MATAAVAAILVPVGLVLALAGFVFFEEALYAFGALAGLGVGLAALNAPDVPATWGLVVLVVAPVAGFVIAQAFRALVLGIPGAIVGAGVGIVVAGASLASPETLVDPFVVGGAVLGFVLTLLAETPTTMFVTATWGASLVSLGVGGAAADPMADLQAALLGVVSLVHWVVFAAGLASQAGIWYRLREELEGDERIKDLVWRRAGQRFETMRR